MLLLSSLAACLPGLAQTPNQRLILKDGSYQVVTKYQKVGDRVRYFSAERGQWEEIAGNPGGLGGNRDTGPKIMRQERKPAEPARRSRRPSQRRRRSTKRSSMRGRALPDVSPGLRLPDQDGVWALDTFHDQPELVALDPELRQCESGQTGHNVLRASAEPARWNAAERPDLPVRESKVKLHVNDPALYVSIPGSDDNEADASAVTVDTHGAGSVKDKNALQFRE